MAIKTLEIHLHPNGKSKDVKRKLYKAFSNVNVLEGIRFYVSFACSFAFGELTNKGRIEAKSLVSSQETKTNT